MDSRTQCIRSRLAAMLIAAMLSACAASSQPMSPVIGAKPQPTPLPASVSRIDPKSSQAWLKEVEDYLRQVDEWLSGEMPK